MDWRERLTFPRRSRARGAGAVPAPRVAVVTDSSCALPDGWAPTPAIARLVRVVPMPVTIGEQVLSEGTDDATPALALALAQGSPVQTSRPAPGRFEAAYRQLADEGFDAVVSLHLSARLSGTADAARLAARLVDIPVTVVDTGSVAMGLGFAVREAALNAAAGGTAEDIAEAAGMTAGTCRILFYVPSLEQLRRGGRIGAAAGWLGTLLAVKPILTIRDGAVVPLERIRTAPRALARLQELVVADIRGRSGRVQAAVHHFGNEPEADRLAAALRAAAPGTEVLSSRLPAVLAAHAGLGVLAVVVAGGVPGGTGPSGRNAPGAAAGAGAP